MLPNRRLWICPQSLQHTLRVDKFWESGFLSLGWGIGLPYGVSLIGWVRWKVHKLCSELEHDGFGSFHQECIVQAHTSSGHPSTHKVCHLGSRPSSRRTRHSSTFVMCSLKITKAEGGVRRVVPGGPDPLDTPAMLIPYQTSYPNPHADPKPNLV